MQPKRLPKRSAEFSSVVVKRGLHRSIFNLKIMIKRIHRLMSSKMEKLHLGSQVLSNCTTFIAAIVLGVWGLYSTFYVNKVSEVTEYTLQDWKNRTNLKPHIQAKVETDLEDVGDSKKLLKVVITLSNSGDQESRVSLDEQSISLVPVGFEDGSPRFLAPKNLADGRYNGTLNRMALDWVDIGSGESYELTYVHLISHPGTYLVHFLSHNGLELKGSSLPIKYTVGADKYIVVK